MALKLLTNRAWADCSTFKVTNSSDVETADTLTLNMVGGARHLAFTQAGTAGLRVVYVNKNNKLTFDTFVMVNASAHVGHAFQLISVASYPGTLTTHVTSTNWAPTLVNGGRDFVQGGLSVTNAEAVGIVLDSGTGGAYTKTINKLYFSTAFALPQFGGMQMSPNWTTITVKRTRYAVDEQRTLTITGLTKAQVSTLQSLPNLLTEPCFIWDDAGQFFSENLYHALITQMSVNQQFNDLYSVTFTLYRLRRYV